MKRTLDEGNSAANINQMSQSQKPETQAVLPYIHEFDEVQKQLLDIDEECANRQIEIQREYDRKKQPHFKKRQEIINKIPGFWARAILHHPALSYLTTADMPVLELLEKVELDDNIDNNGSYKVTLTFGEGAREYMEPLVLTKHVRFSDNKEDVVECTDIHWRPGMVSSAARAAYVSQNPIDVAIKARSDERCIDWSLFEWFTKDEWINRPDFGEILRRELWHAPLAYYLDTVSVDFVDDEYDMLEEDDD